MPSIAGPAAAALASLTPAQRSFIHNLPKAELHAHLNGSIPVEILQDLALEYSPPEGDDLAVSNEAIQAGLEKLRKGVTLDKIEDFFGLFPAIYALTSTPEALERATRGVLDAFFTPTIDNSDEDADAQPPAPECTYLELRTTPRCTPSMSREIYLRTVLSVTSSYPLPPLPQSITHESKINRRIGVIASLDRRMSREVMHEIVGVVIKLKEEGLGIVGVDLCGDPCAGDVEEYWDVFARVREAGLGITLHIAEVSCVSVYLFSFGF